LSLSKCYSRQRATVESNCSLAAEKKKRSASINDQIPFVSKRVFRVLLLSLLVTGIDCRAEENYDSFISLQLENDLWGSNDDRFYTHGSKFSWATNEPAPEFLTRLTELLPFYKKGPIERHGFEIGQAIFTPEDIEATALIEDDRPYASWLYLNTGIGHVYRDRGDRDRLNMLLLTIGIVGPSSLGEETQEAVHSVFDNTDPQGWDNQLEDELGLNFTFLNKSRRIYGFDMVQ